MARTPDPTSTRALYEHLGRDLRAVVRAAPAQTYDDDQALGRTVDGLIAAAIKSALPGRQSDKQVKVIQQAARQAFARKLRRRAALLEPPSA